jgi:penicillin-binding protein 2
MIANNRLLKNIQHCIVGIIIFMSIIIMRLFYLQIYLTHELFSRAQKNYTRISTIAPQRGNILDCHGNLLATNRPVTNIYWQGTGNRVFTMQQEEILKYIAEICQKDFDDETTIQALKHAERTKRKTPLLQDVSFDILSKIIEKFPDCENINIEKNQKRFYPHKTVASHILGYIGSMQDETTGKMGLELLFEKTLRGQDGQLIRMINSYGSNLYQQEVQKASSGADIQTTLDLDLQKISEQCFEKSLSGALIILDPHTGAIKTLISRPTFDPSLFLEPISSTKWLSLQEKRPFLNRAFNAAYPPASLFKLVTISAALELELINFDTIIECKGYISFGGRRYHCNKRSGHGPLSISEWIAKSCNIPFYELGKQISVDELAEYAQRFGLGQKTNIIFNEHPGLVPTTQWKVEAKGERWWPGETLSATIGQSYYLATPIQIARMIAGIFTGYLVVPRILENEPIETQPLGLKPETIKILKHSLKTVVTQGTGSTVNKIDAIKIYAKTGTAQISSLTHRWQNSQLLEHAWFVGRFQYKKTEPLILVILVEHAGTSRLATSIAKKILMNYRSYKEEQEKSLNV